MTVDHTFRNYAIATFLVHGYTPWGVDLSDNPGLPDCGDAGWIMCCGHVLTADEAAAWVVSGVAVVAPEPDRLGRQRLVANGQKTQSWIDDCWHALSGNYEMEGEAA